MVVDYMSFDFSVICELDLKKRISEIVLLIPNQDVLKNNSRKIEENLYIL